MRREPPPASAGEATDLSSALEFAATLLPANRPGRIVVFSDGVFTSGRNPIETVTQLGKVEIDTVPLPAASGPDAAVVSIKLPVSTGKGKIFDLSAQLFSTSAVESATIRLYQNDLLVSETRRELPKGLSEVTCFRTCVPKAAWRLYEVEVTAPQDSTAENNRKKVAIAHSGRPEGPRRSIAIPYRRSRWLRPCAHQISMLRRARRMGCRRTSKDSKRLTWSFSPTRLQRSFPTTR